MKLSSEGEEVVEMSLPVYCSHFLMNILSNICVEINRVSNFDLEKSCLILLYKEIATIFVNVYVHFVETWMKNSSAVSEKAAIQILFDFKFVLKVIDGGLSNTEPSLSEKISRVTSSLKSLV